MIASMLKALILLLGHAVSAGLMVIAFEFHVLVAGAVLALAALVFWISAPEQVKTNAMAQPPDRATTLKHYRALDIPMPW